MEYKLCALGDSLLVDLVGEYLVEVVRLEFLVLIAVPEPDLGLHALHILLFLGHHRLLGAAALELEYIMTHRLIFSLQYI